MKKIYVFTVLIAAAFLFARPASFADSAKEALAFAAKDVIPSLFSFMVISRLILGIDAVSVIYPLLKPFSKLLHLSYEETACFFTGNLCGFPSGAYAVSKVAAIEKYDPYRALTLAVLSNNVSFGFMISYAGRVVIGSKEYGFLIYLSQLASSVIICSFLRRKIRVNNERRPLAETTQGLSELICSSVSDSAAACVNLTGFIVFFSVISGAMSEFLSFGSMPDCVLPLVKSMLELSGGCGSAAGLDFYEKIAVISFASSFSGLCVIFQSAPYLYKCGIKLGKYILLKTVQGVVSCILSLCFIILVQNT